MTTILLVAALILIVISYRLHLVTQENLLATEALKEGLQTLTQMLEAEEKEQETTPEEK